MIRKIEILAMTVLLVAHCSLALGQSPPATILTIDLVNFVEYRQDVSDPAKFATDPNLTTATTPRNFFTATMFADIVAVNGHPAKGRTSGDRAPSFRFRRLFPDRQSPIPRIIHFGMYSSRS
jgi:hypothetical protein